jgi:hypothetical protein
VQGVAVALICGLASPAFAEPKGRGRDVVREQGVDEHAEQAGTRVADEAIDAVADELAGEEGGGSTGMPPGLSKKGKLPPGLEQQGQTPPGWEQE